MKRAYLTIILLILASTSVWAQKGTIKGFDFDGFNRLDKEAEWLCLYDPVAWITSDSVMTEPDSLKEKLDGTWFCVRGSDTIMWWAFYGYMDTNNVFQEVFTYYVDLKGQVHKNRGIPYNKTQNQFIANALTDAELRMQSMLPEPFLKIRYNSYVRVLDDKTIKIWILPAFQTNGIAAFGADYAAVYNNTGTKRLSEDYTFLDGPKGFKVDPPDRVIAVDYLDETTPPLCAIFFAQYYAPYFKTIYLECANSNSVLMTDSDKSYWVHAAKPKKKKK